MRAVPRLLSFTLAFVLQLRKNHGKPPVIVVFTIPTFLVFTAFGPSSVRAFIRITDFACVLFCVSSAVLPTACTVYRTATQ